MTREDKFEVAMLAGVIAFAFSAFWLSTVVSERILSPAVAMVICTSPANSKETCEEAKEVLAPKQGDRK